MSKPVHSLSRACRWLGPLLLVGLLLVGCQYVPVVPMPSSTADADGPPRRPHGDLSQIPDPIPRVEPMSKRGNPKTYQVAGKTYEVWESAEGYVADGNASWYGRKFHGRTTSSGEPFDMFTLTAAHRSLPIPSFAKVTHLDSGRTVVVRINDRGPFHDNRIIDLSYAAAVKLGFHEQGTARVRVEVVAAAQTDSAQTDVAQTGSVPTPVSVPSSNVIEAVYLQAGAFADLAAADELAKQLRELLNSLQGDAAVRTSVVTLGTDALYRVRIGPVGGRDQAQRIAQHVQRANFAPPLILP